MQQVLQLALDKNKEDLVSIYEVKTGIACECFCPECKKPLEAKNNHKKPEKILQPGQKIAHFAHCDDSICVSAPETAIHLLAKKVLQETKTLLIPFLYQNGIKIITEKLIIFDEVIVEKERQRDNVKIQPDIILNKAGRELFIEFYKTHKVDPEKINKIKTLNTCCIEIDLRTIVPLNNGKPNIEGIKELFIRKNGFKKWLFNSKSDFLYKKARLREENEIKAREEESRKEIQEKEQTEAWEKELLSKGFEILEVFTSKVNYAGSWLDESTGEIIKLDVTNTASEVVLCPKFKENGKDEHIELFDCRQCEFFYEVIYEEFNEKNIICGYKNNLKTR